MDKQKNNKSKIFFKILAFLLRIGILVIVLFMANIIEDEWSEYKEIDNTQEQIIVDVVDDANDNKETIEAEFSIDWSELQSINNDVVAWIRIPNTNINYPVVQGNSNNQYLRKNIYGKYSRGGTLFVDANTQNPFDDANTIIHGHNLMNGAMFSSLKKYSNADYCQSHNVIYIYLPNNQIREYEVISFHIVNATDQNIYNPYVTDITGYTDYMFNGNKLRTNKDIEISADSRVITLSTCTNREETTRYVLHAVCKTAQ